MNIQKIKIEELKYADYNPRKALKPADEEYQSACNAIIDVPGTMPYLLFLIQ